MKIFHRIDDIGSYNKNLFEIIEFFSYHTKELLLACIPTEFNENFAKKLALLTNCKICQHGYNHVSVVKKGWKNEFPEELFIEDIFSKVKTGKEILELYTNKAIDIYVPPWNNPSKKLLEVLYLLNFQTLSSQKNNTFQYKENKDIDIDIIKYYKPTLIYKDLTFELQKIISINKFESSLGIMYHFNNTKYNDFEKIKRFIISIEKFNEM